MKTFIVKNSIARIYIALLLVFATIVGCSYFGQKKAKSIDSPFLNVKNETKFVGDKACQSCHEKEYEGYQSHGMAHSFYKVSPQKEIEIFPSPIVTVGDLSYRAYKENGKYYQEEFKMLNGEKIHSLVREMIYIVGSGNAARTYMTVVNELFYQMPLTFYTQKKKWAMSPGYDASNARFDREIPDRCMACHNSYPEAVPKLPGAYKSMPEGIGCERCHGPGDLHVKERTETEEVEGIDYTIVNSKHLNLDKRLDVCQQCHLHGAVSFLQEGETANGFRPSLTLSAHTVLYEEKLKPNSGKISVISHAQRMKESACFTQTVNSKKPMDCTTCHNPHEGFRESGAAYFNKTCISCHQQVQDKVVEAEKVNHTASSNCISCHMPKVEADDVPHSSFTDHKVRVVKENDGVTFSDGSKSEDVELSSYYDLKDNPLKDAYEGVAYIVFGQQNGNKGATEKGVSILQEALKSQPNYSEGQFLLGMALFRLGRFDEAVAPLEKSIASEAEIPERLNTLAQVYEAIGETDKPAALYEKALSVQPRSAAIRTNYGRFLEAQGDVSGAINQYKQSIKDNPWLPEGHYNLGTALIKNGDATRGISFLEEALALNPNYLKSLNNLASIYAQSGDASKAMRYFERALALDGENPELLNNLSTFYIKNNQIGKAIPTLEKLVAVNPSNDVAWSNLGAIYFNQGQMQKAVEYAQKALQINPNNVLAQQVMQGK